MRYIGVLVLSLAAVGCGASAPGPTGGDAAVDAMADAGGDGAAMVTDGALMCPEAMRSICSDVGDSIVDPGGGGGSLHGYWLTIAARLNANDAVTMCPLPPPCWTCPNRSRIWTVATIESITRDYIARGNRCP